MWYTICICYPEGRGDEGVGESSVVRELIGGPLDGLVVEADENDLVWTIPVMFAADEFLNSFPSVGEHVYAYRKSEPGKMFYSGVMPV
tara:strand:+ start:1201 stop:1464 length:264 start_codon:yes stop_codon:yes gene_type:complete